MEQRSPYRRLRICEINYCTREAWTSQLLDICGFHAREVMKALKAQVEAQAHQIAETKVAEANERAAAYLRKIHALQAEAATPTRAAVPKDGVVYYLRSGGFIKIGWTSDLAKRMRAYAPDSVLLAVEPGTRKDEHRMHKMFSAHRTHGREWYAMTPSVMRHIDQVVAKHGKPDAVTFAAKPVEVPQPRQTELVTPRGWTGRRVS